MYTIKYVLKCAIGYNFNCFYYDKNMNYDEKFKKDDKYFICISHSKIVIDLQYSRFKIIISTYGQYSVINISRFRFICTYFNQYI